MLRKAKKHADNDYEDGIAKIKSLLQGFLLRVIAIRCCSWWNIFSVNFINFDSRMVSYDKT